MTWAQQPYTGKLEGAELAGYRAVTICGTRDPLLIATLDDFLARVRDAVASTAAALGVEPAGSRLIIRRYGLHGVLGPAAPLRAPRPPHLALVIAAVAPAPATPHPAPAPPPAPP